MTVTRIRPIALATAGVLLLAGAALAHDPDYTSEFGRDRCTFTTTGSNPYFPLWPGYALLIEGEEEDEGELVEISSLNTVLPETEMVDGVKTRVYEERESEDGELVEVSRNFMAYCRETGDVWYFGEDVDIYEDGEIVSHDGAWRAGVGGAEPGIIMPGNPFVGARYFEEFAPGVAEDQGEIVGRDETVTVPVGTFVGVLHTIGTSNLNPSSMDEKFYAPGVGNIVDEVLELVEITPPPCQPDATTHCLSDGRFRVTVEWETGQGTEGVGQAILPSADSGEFWFFNQDNTELIVKVLDACTVPDHQAFWVFAAGLTNVGVTITVED
ncbi:MAG: hypothetical protein ACREKH_01195, partial [Candidatus Rokuibacteriota bacterium]